MGSLRRCLEGPERGQGEREVARQRGVDQKGGSTERKLQGELIINP